MLTQSSRLKISNASVGCVTVNCCWKVPVQWKVIAAVLTKPPSHGANLLSP